MGHPNECVFINSFFVDFMKGRARNRVGEVGMTNGGINVRISWHQHRDNQRRVVPTMRLGIIQAQGVSDGSIRYDVVSDNAK